MPFKRYSEVLHLAWDPSTFSSVFSSSFFPWSSCGTSLSEIGHKGEKHDSQGGPNDTPPCVSRWGLFTFSSVSSSSFFQLSSCGAFLLEIDQERVIPDVALPPPGGHEIASWSFPGSALGRCWGRLGALLDSLGFFLGNLGAILRLRMVTGKREVEKARNIGFVQAFTDFGLLEATLGS
eukprot:9503770-Pyramimonas_sp.AAC.3